MPLEQPVSAELLNVAFKKKIPIEEKQGDTGEKKVVHPEDEQQLAAPVRHHLVPPLDLPHPFAESTEVPTVPAAPAEQQLLLPPDPPPASKVCKCSVSS